MMELEDIEYPLIGFELRAGWNRYSFYKEFLVKVGYHLVERILFYSDAEVGQLLELQPDFYIQIIQLEREKVDEKSSGIFFDRDWFLEYKYPKFLAVVTCNGEICRLFTLDVDNPVQIDDSNQVYDQATVKDYIRLIHHADKWMKYFNVDIAESDVLKSWIIAKKKKAILNELAGEWDFD